MAARCCRGMSGGVFGWGLPALILVLLGAFSTLLNGLQTLNGLFCFVTVLSESSVEESLVSSFVISGYGHNHLYSNQRACNDIDAFLDKEDYPFCTSWTSTDFSGTHVGFRCSDRAKGKGVIESYRYTLYVNCSSPLMSTQSFMVSLTPGSTSMMGAGNINGYYTVAVVGVNRCALSRYFYFVFTVLCVAITVTIFIIRACMRKYFVDLSFWLSESETFDWAYKYLEKYGFFNFFNPYRNEPYHLVKGEKCYVMRPRSSSTTGSSNTTDTGTLECSSAESVYKFTYVDGEVFAYCKDRCGVEKFAAKVERSIALVIKEYLKQKSRSACVTNHEKSQFLSLNDCRELAQDGYQLVEEISDRDYRMFYWSPRTQSRRSAEPDNLLHREMSSNI